MNDSPLGDVDCRKNTRINSRIPKVSALDKRLRHIISNSNTHAIVDLTQQVNNPMNTAIRSTFTTKNPRAGNKDEMPNFLAWIPKYLSKNSDTKACSDILTKVYEEGIDLFEKMPSLDETAGVAAIPARGGNNPRPAIPAKPPTG